jgi:Membrane domain of glycerophosphoryl diester phosphodiesterase
MPVEPYAGLLHADYQGARHILGRTADAYAIWDRAAGGEPRQLFPATAEGWSQAWLAFREQEGHLPVQPVSGSPVPEGVLPPLGLGGVLSSTFRVYGRNFGAFFLVAATVTIPLAILQVALLQSFLTPELEALFSGAVRRTDLDVFRRVFENDLPLFAVGGIVLAVISLFVTSFVSASLVHGTLRVFGRNRAGAGTMMGAGIRRTPSMAWILFQTAVIVLLAAIPAVLLIALIADASDSPGLVVVLAIVFALGLFLLYVRYLFAPSALIIEDQRGPRALRRSWQLTRGRAWPVLGTFLLVLLITLVPNFLITFPFQQIALEQGSLGALWMVASLGNAVASAVILPFTTAAAVMLYIDARARKEELDPASLEPGSLTGGP